MQLSEAEGTRGTLTLRVLSGSGSLGQRAHGKSFRERLFPCASRWASVMSGCAGFAAIHCAVVTAGAIQATLKANRLVTAYLCDSRGGEHRSEKRECQGESKRRSSHVSSPFLLGCRDSG